MKESDGIERGWRNDTAAAGGGKAPGSARRYDAAMESAR
jgi:hypothetical protein